MRAFKGLFPAIKMALLSIILLSCGPASTNEGVDYVADGYQVVYNGRSFTLSDAQPDTILVFDPITEEDVTTVLNTHQIPIAINGKPIYKVVDVTSAPDSKLIITYLMDSLKDIVTAYRDSAIIDYRIDLDDVVVGEDGHIIYYSFNGVRCNTTTKGHRELNTDYLKSRVDSVLLHAPAMTPASKNGKTIPVLCDISLRRYPVIIREGVATW